jgi:hypothetical protein
MTQAPETLAEDTLNLSDIAAEIGIELTPEEPTPPDPSTDTADPNAETDPSQENTEESQDSPDPSDPSDESEPESEEKSDDEDADDAEEDAPSHTQEKLLRRIDKITAKRREAEEKAEQLETEISDLRAKLDSTPPVTLAPTPDNPLADVESPEQLEERMQVARKVRKWAMQNLEGGTVTNANGEEVYYEPAQVRQYLANADEMLTEHAPKRQQWLHQRQSFVPEARAAYPKLFEPGSQEQMLMRETLKAYPALKAMPNLELVIGDAIIGQQMRFARQQAAQKAASAPKFSANTPAKSAPSAPSPAKGQKVPAKDINARANAKNIFDRGSDLKSDDIAAFLEDAL